jgi:hypothetical protein
MHIYWHFSILSISCHIAMGKVEIVRKALSPLWVQTVNKFLFLFLFILHHFLTMKASGWTQKPAIMLGALAIFSGAHYFCCKIGCFFQSIPAKLNLWFMRVILLSQPAFVFVSSFPWSIVVYHSYFDFIVNDSGIHIRIPSRFLSSNCDPFF